MANSNGSAIRITVGQQDWSAGVDSDKTPTVAGPGNPNGLKPNALAWGNNITVRGGAISPRRGRLKLGAFEAGIGALQEAKMYRPLFAFPYILAQIAGRTFQIRVDLDTRPVPITEVTIPGDPNPATIDQSWMCQGEQFMVIQDGVSVSLVWDGSNLRRVTSMANANPKIPTGEMMCYYMGRLWIAKGREYLAGDIVGGPSGTAAYDFTDSILSMTENTYLSLGGTFRVPTQAGNIRGMAYPANLNTSLGEGQLLVFTREQIYSVNVVPRRADWATLTEPIQRVAQINFGTTSDRSIVSVNGDLFCQSVDGVRSVTQALRYFDQWGDVSISVEENRAIDLNNRELLRFGSGIAFDNRLYETVLPFPTEMGVAHKGLMPLNFDTVSTLQAKLSPAWEGLVQGINILRVVEGDFGGRQRAFALVAGEDNRIQVWELTSYAQEDFNDFGNVRVQWSWESPSFNWGDSFALKELDTIELWIDRLYGDVEFTVEFRPDAHPCWEPWTKWKECAPRNNCEDCGVLLPDACYPTQTYRQQYRATIVLPKPPTRCETSQHRPINIGYSFQFRVFIKGFCRIRGIMVHAFPREKQPYLSVTPGCFSAGCGSGS